MILISDLLYSSVAALISVVFSPVFSISRAESNHSLPWFCDTGQLLAKANAVYLESDPLPKAELQRCLISESHFIVLKDVWKWVLLWKMSWNNMSHSVFQTIFLGCCFSLLAACFFLSKFILYILYLSYYSLTLKSNFHREILLIILLLSKWKHLQESFNFDYFLRSKIILKSL